MMAVRLLAVFGCDEGLIFFFHCGIKSDGDEGGHTEGFPQVSSATADKAFFLLRWPESRAIGTSLARLATHLFSRSRRVLASR